MDKRFSRAMRAKIKAMREEAFQQEFEMRNHLKREQCSSWFEARDKGINIPFSMAKRTSVLATDSDGNEMSIPAIESSVGTKKKIFFGASAELDSEFWIVETRRIWLRSNKHLHRRANAYRGIINCIRVLPTDSELDSLPDDVRRLIETAKSALQEVTEKISYDGRVVEMTKTA